MALFRKKAIDSTQTDSERNLAAAKAAGATVIPTVGIAVGQHLGGGRAQQIETAMQMACDAAQREGVSDPDEIRRRMLAAKDSVLAAP